MSAICGILGKDSSEEQRQDSINRMTESMSLIGPDSLNIWKKDHVILAHQALLVTPEEKTDTQPLSLSDEGLTIVFDGRIYNRGEILETLKERLPPNSSDALLLLKLYRQHGVDAFHKINGEFALAIYDPHRHELLLARDPVGNRSLYYTETSTYYAFASSTEALAKLEEVDTGVDLTTLASYFLYTFEWSRGRTLHKGIKSVPSSHAVHIQSDITKVQRYYTFTVNASTMPLEEAIEGLRYHITRSVEDRLRGCEIAGSCLSGGLDSSAVTAIAANYMESRNRSLHAFSAMPKQVDNPLAQEEINHIGAVIDRYPSIEPHTVTSDQSGPFTGLIEHIIEEDEPFGAFYYINRALAKMASDNGIRTILTGIGGDVLASNKGQGVFLNQLFSDSSLSTLGSLRATLNKRSSLKGFIAHELAIPVIPDWILARIPSRNSMREIIETSILRTDFLERNRFDQRAKDSNLFANRVFKNHINAALYTYNEGMTTCIPNQWGRPNQTECLHPLEDFRLIEYCLNIPAEYFALGPQNRGLFRQAISGLIPESVRTRSSKGAFIPAFHRCVRSEERQIEKLIQKIGDHHPIWSIVDRSKFNRSVKLALSDHQNYQMGNWNLSPQTTVFPAIAYALFISRKT